MIPTIFRICYKREHFSSSGARFEPWDNLENSTPDLCEFPIFEKAYKSDITKNLSYWGLLSPKFEKKANITIEEFSIWIEREHEINPKDCYFLNPVPIVESLFPSTIQHGENCHPGLLGLLQRNLKDAKNIDLSTLYMDINTFSLCNNIIGNRKFWTKYVGFVNDFLESVSKNPEDQEIMYRKSANYGPNKSLPYYTFAVERLFSIFLNLEARNRASDRITFSHYVYTRDALLAKTGLSEPIVDELKALSDIKQMACSAGYPAMMQHWAFFRNRLAQQNQYLFLME